MIEHSVLIIDDDPWMQRVFSRIMITEGFKKYYTALDGYVGIGMAVEYQPTLILLDIVMPELNGCQVLKMIKHIKLLQDIPVVIASTTPNPANISIAIKLGAAGFIVKPFTSATVHNKLVQIFGNDGLAAIRDGKTINSSSLSLENFEDEFDIDASNTNFDIDNFKTKTADVMNVSVIGENTGFQKSGPTVKKDALKEHYKVPKKENVKELEEILNIDKFKYKD